MEIKACRDCLWSDECIMWNKSYNHQQNEDSIKNRLYNLFVNGYDCFVQSHFDEE